MIFSSELSGCMEVGQSLAKVLNDASLIEGKKKDLQSEKHTFPRNRVAEIITETVCKLLEGHKEISDCYPGSTKKNSCWSNPAPCGGRGSDLVDRDKQPMHVSSVRLLIPSYKTFLEASKGNIWGEILFEKLQAGDACLMSGWEGEQRVVIVIVQTHPCSPFISTVDWEQLIEFVCMQHKAEGDCKYREGRFWI